MQNLDAGQHHDRRPDARDDDEQHTNRTMYRVTSPSTSLRSTLHSVSDTTKEDAQASGAGMGGYAYGDHRSGPAPGPMGDDTILEGSDGVQHEQIQMIGDVEEFKLPPIPGSGKKRKHEGPKKTRQSREFTKYAQLGVLVKSLIRLESCDRKSLCTRDSWNTLLMNV